MRMTVTVRALRCHQLNDGTFGLEIPCRELTPEEIRILRELFPHTQDQIGELFAKEALLGAFIPCEERLTSPETSNGKSKTKKSTPPQPVNVYPDEDLPL